MKVHAFAVPALLVGVLATTASPAPVAPRAYKIEVKSKIVQDLTAVGQGPQTQEYSTTSFVHVELRDTTGGKVATITLDSLVLGPGAPMPPDMVSQLKGAVWDGFLPTGGRMRDLTVRGDVPGAQLAESGLQQLFPPVKQGTREGQAWTDTTETTNGGIGIRTVTNYQASSATLDGAKVLQLAGASSASVSGEQQSPQGAITIEGTATGNSTYLIGADGVLRRGTFTSTQLLQVSVAALPEPIPVTVTIEGSSSLLP